VSAGDLLGLESLPADAEKERLERELRHARRLKAVGELAAGVAHDTNNLLLAIQGYGEILLEDLPEGDPLRADVLEITRAAARAAALTRQLLTLSHSAEDVPDRVDLNELVVALETLFARALGREFELRLVLAAEPPRVRVDPDQLEQVLLNLALNARHAMPRGGTIVVETELVELAGGLRLPHATLEPGRYGRVGVLDTGAGMGPEVLARAFEPFFTTKRRSQGTGLGLATAHAIVEQFGGAVVLASEAGVGTAASVYLPARGTIEPART